MRELSNVLTFEIIIPLIVVGGLAWWMIKKKITFDSLLEANLITFFKLVQALSTLGEVVVLSSIATSAGRMTLSDAIFRFGTLGMLEVISTYAFITAFNSQLKKAAEDGHINIFEGIRLILVSGPIFFVGFVFTNFIALAYLESCNYLEMQNFLYNDWRVYFPILGLHFETDPNLFTDAMVGADGYLLPAKRLEWTAYVSIYMTPMLNIALVYFVYQQVHKQFLASRGKLSIKERVALFVDWMTGRVRTGGFKKLKGLASYHNVVKDNMGIDAKDFEKWVYEYIGKNLNTGQAVQGPCTMQDVISGAKTSVDALNDLQSRLVGKSGTGKSGLAGLNDVITEVTDKKTTIATHIQAIDQAKADHTAEKAKPTPDAQKVSNLTVTINSNKNKLKTLVGELERGFTNYDVLRDEVYDQLQNLGFVNLDKSYSDKLIEDSKQAVNDAKTRF